MSPFSRRATAWIVGVSTVSFACAVLFAVVGEEDSARPDHRPSTYGPSAIGHRAFVDLLERLDVDVLVSHHGSGAKAGDRALLVVAEPSADGLPELIAPTTAALVVLPKRRGDESREHRGWIASSSLVDVADVDRVLHAVGSEGRVARPAALRLEDNAFDLAPTIDEPQLVQADDLEAIIAGPDGILLGSYHRGDGVVWVLSDPDLLANHGLGRGDNAPLVVAIVDRMRDGHPVVIDETLHGRESAPSLWRELATFPLVLLSVATLLAVAVLLWSAGRRFGTPIPAPPAIEPGKGFLIAHTAELVERGGHSVDALSRYLATTLQDVARRTHAPPDADGPRLREWLDQLGRARGLATPVADLEAAVAAAGRGGRGAANLVATAAAKIYDWRQAMVREGA